MILCIAEVLSRADLTAIRGALEGAAFRDSHTAAGWHEPVVRRGLQVDDGDPLLADLQTRTEAAVRRHTVFQLAARPKALTPIVFVRYERGMACGTHVDDAMIGGMRTDLSFTLFLSEPEAYDGGELVIESPAGEQPFKLPAGALILHPSTTLHRVEPVTGGTRLAAIGWVRSHVRGAMQRELLFDLDTARRALFERAGRSPEFDLLTKCSANLLRLWAED